MIHGGAMAAAEKLRQYQIKTNKDNKFDVTEADWWAHILSYKGEIITTLLFPVDKLKELVKWSCKEGNGRVVMGGDEQASELALIPLEDLGNGI